MIIEMNKKFIAIVIIIIFLLAGITSVPGQILTLDGCLKKFSYKSLSTNKELINQLPESHIIENVPYISQETSFYCLFACPTMSLKYYGKDVSLQDILYNSGVGYSLISSHPSYDRVPNGGNGAARWELDRNFLGNLYGASYNESLIFYNPNDVEEYWHIFLNKLKENISQNKPVIVHTDPLFLPSIKNPIKIELGIPEINLPSILIELIPSGFYHVVLIVGYNQTSDIIYFHDSGSALWGYPEYGNYASMSINSFKTAILRVADESKIFLGAFSDKKTNFYNETEIFMLAHNRNIEKMKGNSSVYEEGLNILNCDPFGINSLLTLKNHLNGLKNQLTTISIYKFTNAYYFNPFMNKFFTFLDMFYPNVFKMSDWQAFTNYYNQISIEKHNISQYLLEKSFSFSNVTMRDLCKYEADLLEQESENWTILGEYFNKFMKKGISMPLIQALIIINNMKIIVEKIIKIQGAIIEGPPEDQTI
jgi:hypothetical protein